MALLDLRNALMACLCSWFFCTVYALGQATQPTTASSTDDVLWTAEYSDREENLKQARKEWDGNDFHLACIYGLTNEVEKQLAVNPKLTNTPKSLLPARKVTRGDREYPVAKLPLRLASSGGHIAIVKLLLKAGAEIDGRTSPGETTALGAAVPAGHADVAKLLLDAGATIRGAMQKTSHTGPLLNGAVNSGNPEVVKLLLDHGVTPLQPDSAEDALALAACNGNLAIVELLFNVDADAAHRENALYEAARKGHRQVVRSLLARGVGVTLQRDGAATALHLAAWDAKYLLAADLIHAGADPTIKERTGKSAIDIANSMNDKLMLRILYDNK